MTSSSDVERENFHGAAREKNRLFRPEDIYDEVLGRIINSGKKLIDRIGDPMDSNTLYAQCITKMVLNFISEPVSFQMMDL